MLIEMIATATFAATLGVAVLMWFSRQDKRPQFSVFQDSDSVAAFLFDGETLVDSTSNARALLSTIQITGSPWAKLSGYLAPHLDDFSDLPDRLRLEGVVTHYSEPEAGRPLLVEADMRGGLVRIRLSDPSAAVGASGPNALTLRAMTDELALLRQTAAKSPILIWRENSTGDVIWSNSTYLMLVADHLVPGKALSWPLPRLFDRISSTLALRNQRQSVAFPGGSILWFEVTSEPEGTGRLLFALPCDAAVTAEASLRDFMQTLTKTFAQLPIGLAIFDDQRHLHLFNPALLDLTGLPVDFLTLRPSLTAFLDAMRDRNMIPEPKDYHDWRHQIVNMERAAASGLYEETWNLPDGQIFRVIGRPHPNGALALMIEDISSEMLRTRRYRADLDLGQSVIDTLNVAVAVFAQSGQLVMSNRAYTELWGNDPGATLAENTMQSMAQHWRALSTPSALWAEIESFSAMVGNRLEWQADTRLLDGREVQCRVAPLAGGATLTEFRPLTANKTDKPRLAKGAQRQSA